jgi:hypothetical protein
MFTLFVRREIVKHNITTQKLSGPDVFYWLLSQYTFYRDMFIVVKYMFHAVTHPMPPPIKAWEARAEIGQKVPCHSPKPVAPTYSIRVG